MSKSEIGNYTFFDEINRLNALQGNMDDTEKILKEEELGPVPILPDRSIWEDGDWEVPPEMPGMPEMTEGPPAKRAKTDQVAAFGKIKSKGKSKGKSKARKKAKRDLMKAKRTLKKTLIRYNKVMKM